MIVPINVNDLRDVMMPTAGDLVEIKEKIIDYLHFHKNINLKTKRYLLKNVPLNNILGRFLEKAPAIKMTLKDGRVVVIPGPKLNGSIGMHLLNQQTVH